MAGSILPISMVARDRMMRGCWWNLAPYCCDTTIRTLFRIAIPQLPYQNRREGVFWFMRRSCLGLGFGWLRLSVGFHRFPYCPPIPNQDTENFLARGWSWGLYAAKSCGFWMMGLAAGKSGASIQLESFWNEDCSIRGIKKYAI